MRTSLPARPAPPPPPADIRCRWSRAPEFACAATAVSLLMPHVEPYVVRTVRAALPDLDDPALASRTRAYLRQEAAHHAHHRRFNEAVCRRYGGVATLDRWMGRTYRWLGRRGTRFGLAYAAGFEAVAFASARWAEHHRDELFGGADPAAADLFLWHLAEEVEHKDVAHEVFVAAGGTWPIRLLGTVVALALLVWFTFLGTVVLLAGERRLLHPIAWARLVRWGFGFVFDVFPTLALTVLPDHHPDQLADPLWLRSWLAERDAGVAPTAP